ncbi:ABC transporter permease [Gluconacetobacter asukensis]|nr:ABC transporter permease [Gluconacetobacter asukensis]
MSATQLAIQSLRSLWRTFRHRPTFLLINACGLALGLATFLVLASIARTEFSYDAWIPDTTNIVRIDTAYGRPGATLSEFQQTPYRLFYGLEASIPEIAAASRYAPTAATVMLHGAFRNEIIHFVDPDFLKILRYPLLVGDAQALSRPDGAVLSAEIAQRYFGSAQASIGQILDFNIDGHAMRMMVRGVLARLPRATTARPDILLAMPDWTRGTELYKQWGMTDGALYLRLRGKEDRPALMRDMVAFIHGHAQDFPGGTDAIHVRAVALSEQHARGDRIETGGFRRKEAIALAITGLLALTAAIINALNLLTARALLRGREIAMRKVLGASPVTLAGEALLEAMALVAIAAVPSMALVEIGLPVVDTLGGWAAEPAYPWLLGLTAGAIVPTGFLAGAYPAIVLSRVRVGTVLAASRMPGLGRMGALLRAVLVMVQFVFAVGLSICALTVMEQAKLEATAARGFSTPGLVTVGILDPIPLGRRQAMLDAMAAVPGVKAVTTAWTLPGGQGFASGSTVRLEGAAGQDIPVAWQLVGPRYAETLGIRLLAGRLFDNAHRLDDDAAGHDYPHDNAARNVLIDANLARRLGFAAPADALDARIKFGDGPARPLIVVGVLDNIRLGSARDATEPALYFYDTAPFAYSSGLIRVQGRPIRDVIADLGRVWHGHVPDLVFTPTTIDTMLNDAATPERALGQLMLMGTVIAIAIAVIGIYGLASFDAARRSFEIGIRKTLGATAFSVMALTLMRFLRPVWPACLIGSATAFLVMRGWLAGYDLRTALTPVPFLLCSFTTLVLCILIIGAQTWRLARMAPAKAIRHN